MNKKTVRAHLDAVDYKALNNYIPSQFALEFVNFIKLVNGTQGEENETPIFHYKMLDSLITDDRQVATMVFRGAAKTTLMAEYLILYLAVFKSLPSLGAVSLMVYLTDSIDNGVKSMRKNLEYRRENSPFLMKYIPHIKFTDIRWEFVNKEGQKLIVKAYGAKSGIRGVKEQGTRPQLAILDDLVSDDDARSPTVLESIKATVHEALMNAIHPTKSKVIWLGTPFNASDPLYEVVESGAWRVNVYPVCQKFPCKKAEFIGAWEDRFSFEAVNLRYQSAKAVGRVAGFYQELMLQILNDDERLILDTDLRWFDLDALNQNKHHYHFYITTDFATSEKQAADFSFMSVWAINHRHEYFWVDGVCKRQSVDKNINDLFNLVQKWQPQSVGIEISGQQAGFVPWIMERMHQTGVYFALAGEDGRLGLRPKKGKLERFNVLVPDFKLGKFYFALQKKQSMALSELLNELRQVTQGGFKSKHDDALDTISMLSMMQTFAPIAPKQRANETWQPMAHTSTQNSYIV